MTATPEITWLVYTCILTALLWVPYILQIIGQMGLIGALSIYDGGQDNDAAWAARAKRAHYNAVENLVVFAPLAILLAALNLSTPLTQTAAMIYFLSRVAHYVIFLFGLPFLRTISFAVGVFCHLIMAFVLLGGL